MCCIAPFANEGENPVVMELYSTSFIPRQQVKNRYTTLLVGKELERSGTYTLQQNGENVGQLSFRIDPIESDIRTYTAQELTDMATKLAGPSIQILEADSTTIKQQFAEWQLGKQYWRHFLLLALIFVLVEVILLRFLK